MDGTAGVAETGWSGSLIDAWFIAKVRLTDFVFPRAQFG